VNQHIGEVDPAACASHGFGLVRRMTGGRAVLHQHELTYSVIAPESDPRVLGGVIESYRKISAALVEGLRTLGADVSLAPPSRELVRAMVQARQRKGLEESPESSHGAVCFDSASAYELTAGGRKLVGSAQARRGGAILQHGSILLDIDLDAWVSVFAYATQAGRERTRQKLPMRMTSLRHELGRFITAEEAIAALAPAFEQTLSIELERGDLSDSERDLARTLEVEKYGANTWTLKK
jgi:lipoate-protein ligase A